MRRHPAFTIAVLACATLWLGCATSGGVRLTDRDLDTLGSRTFAAPRPQVFAAAVAALKAEGYEVVFEDPEKGLVETGQKLVRTWTTSEAFTYGLLREEYSESTTVDATRRYSLRVGPETPGGVTVRAVPQVFVGPRDVSADAVWDMDGPAGEPVLWQQLFTRIESLL